MPGDVRWSAATPIMASIIVALTIIGAGAAAQSADPAPPGSGSAEPCAGWGTARAGRPDVAVLPGAMVVSALAVEAAPDEPPCVLPIEDAEAVEPQALRGLVRRMAFQRFHVLGDAGDDQLTLDGDPVVGELDPALDLTTIRFAGGSITGQEAADVRRFLRRSTELQPVYGVPPADLIKRGEWQLIIADTAGDPTAPIDSVRTWEIGVQDQNAMRNVPGFPGVANPYAGIRHLYTYAQVPVEGGGFEGRVGHTDFGSDRPGPDGQTPFFNAAPGFVAFPLDDAVGFLIPADQDPMGFRVYAHGGATDGWDMGTGPGGPMALIPTDGSAPRLFDLFQPRVSHESITQTAVVDGGAKAEHQFDSRIELVFGSPLLDPLRPVRIDVRYTAEGRPVRIDDLVARPLGDGLFGTAFGVPGRGVYELDRVSIIDLARAPRPQEQRAEVIRLLGTPLFRIDEDEGPLHGPLIGPWVHGPGTGPAHPYDPALLDLLIAPEPIPGVIRTRLPAGDVAEPTVDIVDIGVGRGAASGSAPGPITFAIRTLGGPAPDDAYSNMVGIRCRDASDASGTGDAFSIIREHHDGVERILTEGIPESNVTYGATDWGHVFQFVTPEDIERACEAFTGFMSVPDGLFLQDTSRHFIVGRTRPIEDVVETLQGLMEPAPGDGVGVAVTRFPRGDVSEPEVDITDLAVTRSDLGAGRSQVGLAIRTASAPPTPNAIPGTFGSAERIDCRLVRSGTNEVITEFTILHHRWEGNEVLTGGPSGELPPGVRYHRMPWGHAVTFELDEWPEDAELRCTVKTSQGTGALKAPLTDTTGEVILERTPPVGDILDEIDEVFVPA